MTTDTKVENQARVPESSSSADTVVGFAVLGLLAAGTIGVVKALSMDTGFDVLLCLLGFVAAFGSVYYIYFGRS